MAQQINLFDTRFIRREGGYSSRRFARALIGLLGVAGLGVAIVSVQRHMLRAERAELLALREAAQQIVARVRSESPRAPDPALGEEATRLQAQLSASEQLLAQLERGDFGPTQGVSGFFTAFARERVDGVWLTRIRVDARSGEILLGGGVLSPALLPAYLARIGSDATLRGRTFERLRMAVHEGDASRAPHKGAVRSRYIEFELGAARPRAERP